MSGDINFIEDLLAQVTAGQSKQASDDGKGGNPFAKKDDDGKDKDKDKDGEGKDKDKDGKDGEGKQKEASTGADLITMLTNELPDDMKKLASDAAQVMLMADLARRELVNSPVKQASNGLDPAVEYALFNQAFEQHTQKLAALDPEYAAMLHQESVKQAFNLGFEQTVQAVKQAALAGRVQ